MAYSIFIVTPQSVSPGTDIPVELDPTNVIPGCDAEFTLHPDFTPYGIEVPAGSYTAGASAELSWAGEVGGKNRIVRVEVYDTDLSLILNEQNAAQTTDINLTTSAFVVSGAGPGYIVLRAGLQSGAPAGQQLVGGFLSVSCGNPWTVGRVAWGSRGAWH